MCIRRQERHITVIAIFFIMFLSLSVETQTGIAFNQDDDKEIYVMNADGSGQIRLTQNPGIDFFPTWSPVGNRIAFASSRNGNLEIFVMSGDGSEPINLTNHPADDGIPTWDPDGVRIAFQSKRDGDLEIYVMSADGSAVTQLTNNSVDDCGPAWSPDGKLIAFESDCMGGGDIYLVNLDGTGLTRVTTNPVDEGFPTWQPFTEAPPTECGTWQWDGPTEEKDLRITTTQITDDAWENCRGAFELRNETSVFLEFGAYSLELQASTTNAELNWSPQLFDEQKGKQFLLPPLDLTLYAIPVDPSSDAQVLIQGNMTLNSFRQDFALVLISSALDVVLDVVGIPCIIPEEQIPYASIKISNTGVLDEAIQSLFQKDLKGAKDALQEALGEFFGMAAEEIGVDCFFDLAEKIVKTPALTLWLIAKALSWSFNVSMDYWQFSGQPAIVSLTYSPPSPPPLLATEVIEYFPSEMPTEEVSGSCWTFSLASPRPGVWRCTSDNRIYDPCFSPPDETGYVVCSSVKLNLTEPLPDITPPPQLPVVSVLWFELEDGVTCNFLTTGTRFSVDGQFYDYACSDGSIILELQPGQIWIATKARVDGSSIVETSEVKVKTVWK